MWLMRAGWLVLGLVALLVVWLGPLPALAQESFSAHMAGHMTIVAIAAPLIAIGVAGTRRDPTRAYPWLRAPVHASIFELIVVWAWHVPALHLMARHEPWALALEQASFLGAALWLWIAAVGGTGDRSAGHGAGVFALLLTTMHMTLLGALLALATRPLYQHHDAIGALSPLADQQLGGAIMLLVGSSAYLAGGLLLTAGLLGRRTRQEPCV
jgi:putative membrane protein